MIDLDLKTEVATTRTCTVKLTGKEIIFLLRQELKARGVSNGLPDDAEVEFSVPSGSDYSGCILDIDELNPIIVRWMETD